ncbi:hypothetical protein BH09BAC4_BH09BAC4_05240 [soil metagenome]
MLLTKLIPMKMAVVLSQLNSGPENVDSTELK